MRYAQLRDFLRAVADDESIEFQPGPRVPQSAGKWVMLTRVGGGGLETEGVLDNVSWQVRVAGEQENYESVENLALDLDRAILNLVSGPFQGMHLVRVEREGSPPTVLDMDDADRTQFVCSYAFTVESGLSTGGMIR